MNPYLRAYGKSWKEWKIGQTRGSYVILQCLPSCSFKSPCHQRQLLDWNIDEKLTRTAEEEHVAWISIFENPEVVNIQKLWKSLMSVLNFQTLIYPLHFSKYWPLNLYLIYTIVLIKAKNGCIHREFQLNILAKICQYQQNIQFIIYNYELELCTKRSETQLLI